MVVNEPNSCSIGGECRYEFFGNGQLSGTGVTKDEDDRWSHGATLGLPVPLPNEEHVVRQGVRPYFAGPVAIQALEDIGAGAGTSVFLRSVAGPLTVVAATFDSAESKAVARAA